MLVILKIYASAKLNRSQTAAAWQEAQLPVLLTSCGVPNICKVYWAFQQCGVIVLVEQYCERAPFTAVQPMARVSWQAVHSLPRAAWYCCCLQCFNGHAGAEGNLASVLAQRGAALSERETCCMLVVPLLVTLWHLSQHKILHGDIKLENIFVSNKQVYLGDFGASQRVFVRSCPLLSRLPPLFRSGFVTWFATEKEA